MYRNVAEELKRLIQNNPIGEIDLKDLLKPRGYAYRVAHELKITKVQVRKIYAEFKGIYESLKRNGWKFDEEILTRLYMLYPIIEYQKNRRVLDKSFADLITALIENIEKFPNKKNIETAEKFFTAIVAYIPTKD
ncbi:MAG TPA: type III-A CRISPR-associated protein Csm2 [Aquificaceae bacterium]|nr:type III-A CRISPR-associated protein Csm2 [Aquificaceae bacterium]